MFLISRKEPGPRRSQQQKSNSMSKRYDIEDKKSRTQREFPKLKRHLSTKAVVDERDADNVKLMIPYA